MYVPYKNDIVWKNRQTNIHTNAAGNHTHATAVVGVGNDHDLELPSHYKVVPQLLS